MENISDSIIHMAMRLENIANKHIFNQIGMTSASIKIMCVLAKHPFTNTPTKLVEFIGGTRSNVSQRLDYLEKNGFIRRKHDDASADKRKVTVLLTTKGKNKLLEAEKWIKEANMYLEKYFTKRELSSHSSFIKKLNQVLDEAEKNQDPRNNS